MLYRAPGDAASGRSHFVKHCANCHKLHGKGEAVGPDLATAETSPDGQPIMKRVTVVPDATVEVSNVQGRVEVATWDKNDVELVATLESPKDELEFEATDRYVRIEVERPKSVDSKLRARLRGLSVWWRGPAIPARMGSNSSRRAMPVRSGTRSWRRAAGG